MKMIEPKQIQLIHIAAHQLRLSREEYEAAIMGQTKGRTASSKELTYSEAHDLIEHFKSLGFRIRSRKCGWCAPRRDRGKVAPNITYMVSQGQTDMIAALKDQVRWRCADGYERWLSKYAKTDQVRTSLQASRVIEGLKGILRSQADCRGCRAIKF
jgi:phage gp16-like protein